jgi:putative sigma-54 modulation protein
MQFQVKGRNLEVSDAIRSYAEAKLSKLERQLTDPRVELELAVEKNPSIAENNVAEATIWTNGPGTNGPVLRAREASGDMRASIDQLVAKLERQINRYRTRRRDRRRRAARASSPTPDTIQAMAEDEEPQIVKTKQFALNPMSAEEAVLQLELVGHDFFVFRSAASGDVNVVYRRNDGGYGLIEPQ